MIREKMLSRSVRAIFSGGIMLGMAGASMQALAQEKIEAVYVTGTRITTPGTTSNSPISSIAAEEIKSSQPIAVEEFFKGLPAAVPAVGPATNNGTGGGATIDLRGLGTNRTLVLVNNRRLVPFNLNGTVDTNSVPIALISRADILTGGASVVYGADAVAGVVNFNLNRKFTGVDLSTSYGTSGEKDAKRRRTDLTVGANLADNRGNVVLSLGTTKADPLRQGDRPFGITNLNSVTGIGTGSGTTVPAAFSTSAGTGGTTALAGRWQIDPATGALIQPVGLYNTNPLNYYVTGMERSQATAMGNFRINEYADVYADLFYTNTKVSSTLAESGTFGNTFNVPIGNPYIPAAARQQLCARRGISAANCVEGNATLVPLLVDRRFVELGPRLNNFDNKTLQYTVGVKGEIALDWTYDASYSRGTADQDQTRQNWGSLAKVGQSLNALNKTTCVNTANNCVPLNVFGAAGSITPAMLGFINLNALLRQSVQQDVALATVQGDFGDKFVSPWAQVPVSMSLTLEQRKVSANTASDNASQTANEVLGTGAATPDRFGQFTMREAAVEAMLPIVKDKPFIKVLNVELGYRHTESTTAGNKLDYGSWKTGAEWAPIDSLRLRASVQKATRAPNVNELFAPLVTGLSNLATDPCQGTNISQAQANTAGTLSNLCRLTGVPVGEIGSLAAPSSGQINNLSGGNLALGPEEAKTKTLGFVWQPVAKLAVSVDYYKIDITKAVSSKSTADVLSECYDAAKNPTFAVNESCGQVGRNTINGTFNGGEARGVATPLSNLGTQSTSGYDVNATYRLGLKDVGMPNAGNVDIGLGFTRVQEFLFQATPSSVNRDCLGFYSTACNNVVNAPVFKNKFSQRATWNMGSFSLGYNWRYLSAVNEEPGGTVFLPAFSHIKAYNYLDLSAVYFVTKNLRLNLAITNATDKQPPIVGGTIGGTGPNSGNTFPQTYDAVGRYFSFGASLKF